MEAAVAPAPSAGDLSSAAESSASGSKRKRIWAACEACRKRKSKCNGQNPCAGCIATAAASTSGVTAQQLCQFDWNRKPRGPKGKKAADHGAPRNSVSAGKAYIEAQRADFDQYSPQDVQSHSSKASLHTEAPHESLQHRADATLYNNSKASLSAWDALADASSYPRSNSVSSVPLLSSSDDRPVPSPIVRPASPPHREANDTRYHDQSLLIDRLRPYYSERDRPFVALAISQFEALDSFEKMIPSRYLFGGGGGRDPPAHLLLALLAFLAHRALLLPDSMNIEDLDLQAGDIVLRCANNYCRLEGDDRRQMLSFARRSWSLANNLVVQKIRGGEVDPRLIMTGMLLEMGAGEDGISSKGQAQRKMWLFRIVFCWRLHQLDGAADGPWESGPVLEQMEAITGRCDDVLAPLPRVADARFDITDMIELEALRRQISLIVTAAYWIQTSEMQTPKFDITMLQLNPADADDLIHRGSNWVPKRHPASNGYLTQTRDLIFAIYGRINKMLHTPLADICTGAGPEPDLQRAITDMETTLDWLMDRVGTLDYTGPEMPLRVAAFIHSRLCVLFMCRLFTSIEAFFRLFPERTAIRTEGTLRIASTLVPTDQKRSNSELIAADSEMAVGGRRLLARPRFLRDPMAASVAMLWEVGAVAKKLLALHRARAAALEPTGEGSGQTGNGVGRTMDASLRAVRLPRHLRAFAQHAFAMAAEARASGGSNESELWAVGDVFLELLEEMGAMGSAHARQNAATTAQYRRDRYAWAISFST